MKYQNGQPLLGLVPAGVLDRHSQPNFQTSGYSTGHPWRHRRPAAGSGGLAHVQQTCRACEHRHCPLASQVS